MVAAALNEIREGWRVEDEGLVRGPGTLAVGVTETTRMNLVTSHQNDDGNHSRRRVRTPEPTG
jgi:hypothetical protein